MYYLIYASQTRHVWTESELIALLQKSRSKNKKIGVTGMLVFLNDRFIQILEGEKPVVNDLLEKIIQDTRHEKIIVVLEGELEKRNFSDWSMGFSSIDNEELKKLTGFNSLEEIVSDKKINNESHPALIFLKVFYEKNFRHLSSGY